MSKIAVMDIDEVLVDTVPTMVSILEKKTGIKMSGDIKKYSFNEYFNISFEELLKIYKDNKVIENCPINRFSYYTYGALKKMGYNVCLLSSRGWHSNGYEVTKGYFEQFNIKPDEIILLDPLKGETKSEALASLGEVDFFLDDSLSHIEQTKGLKNVKNRFLLNKPWNQGQEVDYRVENHLEVLNIMHEKNRKSVA